MSIKCQGCYYENLGGSDYCIRCGKPLAMQGAPQSPQGGFPAAAGGQTQQQMFAQSPPIVRPAPTSMGSVRRAFAGHGTLIKHQSWLLDGQQTQVMNVRQAILDKFAQRNLDASRASLENLIDQGLIDEHRDYIKFRRKSTSVFVYATPAGHDLYISRATTVQPGLSLLRTIALALGLLIIVLPFFNIAAAASTLGASAQGTGAQAAGGGVTIILSAILLLFFSLPLLWLLVVALFHSFASLALDKDFWILLRPNRLTEFQRDEVALMEHTTDAVVREAMKQLGLDADKITAPPTGYQPAGRIRLI